MFVSWLFAAGHLLALGIGLGAVWARGLALRFPLGPDRLRRVFHADTWWGIAAIIWITTGLVRAFGGLEKGTAYYLHNHYFLLKMGLLVVILALEVWPMVTLIKWRVRTARGIAIDYSPAGAFARISFVQAGLVGCMVLAATAMARGYGVR